MKPALTTKHRTMNTSKLISSALLISGLFLSQNVNAQSERSANHDQVDVQQVDNSVQTQDVDNSRQTQDVDNSQRTYDAEDSASGGSILPLALGFEIDGHKFSVSGGEPGAMCGIMFGWEIDSVLLPSGAFLYLKPVLIFGIGRFDANGRYELTVGYDAKMLVAMKYHFQAIALEGEDQHISTSELRTLDFTNLGSAGTDERAADQSGAADGDVDGATGDVDADAAGDVDARTARGRDAYDA
jgi:hypothetical protein